MQNRKRNSDKKQASFLYEHVLESMSNGVIALDFEGKIIIFNSALSAMLQIDSSNAVGKKYAEVFYSVGKNEKFHDIMIEVIYSEAVNEYAEVVYVRENGSKLPLGITSSYLKDDDGVDYGIISVITDLTEIKKREFLQDTLTRYVTRQVVDEILTNPEKMKLDGEEKEATILFTDIRGFTGLVEEMNPIELVKLLRAYFILMVGVVFMYNGTLDKFIGDSIMALFGAPVSCDNHAELAVYAAIEMKKLLETFNEERIERKQKSSEIGIGISTGNVIVGNMGCPERFEYTAIGDTVNLASRIEEANKYYGTYILITESTKSVLSEKICVREIDTITVRGRKQVITIYEVVNLSEEIEEEYKVFLKHYNNGLLCYKNMKWKKAIESYKKAFKIYPDDRSTVIFLERCKEYMSEPPPPNWDGVFDLELV